MRRQEPPRKETMNIYVGNLPYAMTEDEVRNLFSAYGTVAGVRLVTDRGTPVQRHGFAFDEKEVRKP